MASNQQYLTFILLALFDLAYFPELLSEPKTALIFRKGRSTNACRHSHNIEDLTEKLFNKDFHVSFVKHARFLDLILLPH